MDSVQLPPVWKMKAAWKSWKFRETKSRPPKSAGPGGKGGVIVAPEAAGRCISIATGSSAGQPACLPPLRPSVCAWPSGRQVQASFKAGHEMMQLTDVNPPAPHPAAPRPSSGMERIWIFFFLKKYISTDFRNVAEMHGPASHR